MLSLCTDDSCKYRAMGWTFHCTSQLTCPAAGPLAEPPLGLAVSRLALPISHPVMHLSVVLLCIVLICVVIQMILSMAHIIVSAKRNKQLSCLGVVIAVMRTCVSF